MPQTSWWGLWINGVLFRTLMKDSRPFVSDFGVVSHTAVQYEIDAIEIKRKT